MHPGSERIKAINLNLRTVTANLGNDWRDKMNLTMLDALSGSSAIAWPTLIRFLGVLPAPRSWAEPKREKVRDSGGAALES
jgi:hypothetical protein